MATFIGALKKKEKEKDNQYKLKETMAIIIGLRKCYYTISTAETCSIRTADVVIYYNLFILDVADTGIFMKGGQNNKRPLINNGHGG